MDKETAVEIERLKGRLQPLEEEHKAWTQLIRNTIIKTISWLLGVGALGVLYGWHMPENIRKAIADWMSK